MAIPSLSTSTNYYYSENFGSPADHANRAWDLQELGDPASDRIQVLASWLQLVIIRNNLRV